MPTEHLVTPTGWRVVGGRATALVNESAVFSAGLVPGDEQDALYAARFHLRPLIGKGSVVPPVLATLHGAIARDWQDAPPLTPDRPLERSLGRFHGLRWITRRDGDVWTGELLWRHAHPAVAGAPCTTHVIVNERPGITTLALRVTADDGFGSVRGYVGAGQARPPFLSELARCVRLLWEGKECSALMLEERDIEEFVREVLLSESREYPVVVLAPLEAGGYVVPLTDLADELLGLARLYVMHHHPSTFRLSDALGDRRLSCYWGALRAYMPGFSCAERPEDHPLLIHDRVVDPVMRAGLFGKLGRTAAQRMKMPTSILVRDNADHPVATELADIRIAPAQTLAAPPRPAPAPASPAPLAADPGATSLAAQLTSALGGLPHVLSGLDARIAALSATIAQLVSANTALADEITRLRTTTALRASGTASLERRFDALREALSTPGTAAAPEPVSVPATATIEDAEADSDIEPSDTQTLVDVVRQAATTHGDALLVLDAAERAAAESPYEDMDRLAVVLDAMAIVARRRQEGALGTSLRVAFRELGIDYRGGISASTPGKLRRQYLVPGADGREFDCHEHIVLGNSYDPRYCLRVYFTSRAPVEPRFVIGHVGRHFDVLSTT